MKKILSILAFAAIVLSCSKESAKVTAPAKSGSNIVNITVSAEKAIPEADGAETKLSYDWSSDTFGWEADDKLQICLCKWKDEGHSAAWTKNVVVDPVEGKTGVFAGQIDLSNGEDEAFTYEDIKGVFAVKSLMSNWNVRRVSISGVVNMAIAVPFALDQEQAEAGVFTSGTTFPFYSGIVSGTSLSQMAGGDIALTGVKLVAGCSILEYHIYADPGEDPDPGYASEKIESITVSTPSTATNLSCIHANTIYWSEISNTARRGYSASNKNTGSVSLVNPVNIPASRDESAVLWHSVPTGAKSLVSVVVKTDVATYTKTFEGHSVAATKNRIYPLYMNLAKFDRVSASSFQYSIDGGATWLASIPSAFTTLAVKSDVGAAMPEVVLEEVREAIDAQASPVALDLSAIEFESATFPAVFGNATAASASTKLKSIVFPSNTTGLAADAFYNCTGLSSMDLTGMTALGNNCLRNTGITEINVPNTVKSLGTYVLADNSKLSSVYWACADPVMANFGTSNRKDYFTLAMANSDTAPTADLVVTIAPNTYIPRYFFRYNNNLKKLIFEPCTAIRRIGNNSFQNTRYLAEIEIQGTNPALFPYGSSDVYNANIGAHVAEADRKILTPGVTTAAATGQTASSSFYASGTFFPKLVTDLSFTVIGND